MQRSALKDSCCSKKHNKDECTTAISRCLLNGKGNDGWLLSKEAQFHTKTLHTLRTFSDGFSQGHGNIPKTLARSI